MRCVVVAVLGLGLAQPALAADMGILRGSTGYDQPARYQRWDGVYGGGQAGYSTAGYDFGTATSSLLDYMLRSSTLQDVVPGWTTLPKGDTNGWSAGAFLGYNFQYDDVVVGVEGNYNRMSNLGLSAQDSLTRLVSIPDTPPANGDRHTYNVTVSSGASAQITDVATLRGRAGWATGPLLPYAFAGLAVGRADISRSAAFSGTDTLDRYATDAFGTVTVTRVYTNTPLQGGSMSDGRKGVFIYGYTLGLGLDFALTQNLFARAEWEWVDFRSNDIKMHTNSVRGGLGLKF